MAGFLYFVSGDQRPPTAAKIDAWGLRYAFNKPTPTHRAVGAQSPNGQLGSVLCDADRLGGKVEGYYPDQQSWRKMPRREGRPETWLGYWNDARPRPEDLRRPLLLSGVVTYQMGEGCHWEIPTLCELDAEGRGDCALPAPEDYDDNGNLFVSKPIGSMGELWQLVHPIALGVCGFPGATKPSYEAIRGAAIELIKANYVIDMPELAALGALYRDERYERVVMASCRGQWLLDAIKTINADEKKTTSPSPESGSVSSGGGAV